jgi:hypothetical protein
MRLPLQISRPLWLQYRQIARWTNRGNVCGKAGLNCRVSIRVGVCAADPFPGAVAARAYFA